MIFWIAIAIIVIGCALIHLYNNTWFDYEWVYGCGLIMTVVGVIAAVIMLFGIIFEYGCADGFIAENTTRYETLVYQYENDIYENDNDLGKRELMKDIQEWNETLAWRQAVQENFWVGIFYANIYDQFEFIELKEMTSDVQN